MALSLLLIAVGVVVIVAAIGNPAGATGHHSVLIVGDSVTVAAEAKLQARIGNDYDLAIDAEENRATSAGPEIVDEATSASAVDVLVVELGYNDGGTAGVFSSRVNSVLAAANADVIIWLTLREDDRNTFDYGPANDVLVSKTDSDPRLRLLDWNQVSQDDDNVADGIHLTSQGSTLFADVVQSAVATAIATGPKATCTTPSVPDSAPDAASADGYWLLDSHGNVYAYGGATHYGDLITDGVGVLPGSFQATPTGLGYWIVDENGSVHAYGDAVFAGDMTGVELRGPVRRLEAHPDGSGYWLVASDGGVFSFGGVAFHGSTGALVLDSPVSSLSATSTGDGYWLVAGDGGVFTFGEAVFRGSTGGLALNAPVIDLARHPDGSGYWLYAEDGGVFSFGVAFHGSTPGLGLCDLPDTVAMRATATGSGYWLVTAVGWVLTFGDAIDYGGQPALPTGATIIDMAIDRVGL